MFCDQCGTELANNILFCPKCGAKQGMAAPAEQRQQQPVKKKKSAIRLIVPIAAAAVVLMAVLAVLLLRSGGAGGADKIKDMPVYLRGEDRFVNLSSGDFVEAEGVTDVFYSAEGGTTMYLTGDKELYYITRSLNSILVAEDVCYVMVGTTGEYAAYTVKESEDITETTLYIYDVRKDKSTKIDKNVYAYYLALSPSGKTVAYLKNYEGETDNTLYVGGISVDSRKIDKDGCYPIALTDNGKNVYYYSTERKFYYYNGKETIKIAADVNTQFFFNKAVTEVIFVKNGKTYFYTPKMEDPIRILNESTSGIEVPGRTASEIQFFQMQCSTCGQILPFDTLKGQILWCDNGLYWFDKKGTDTVKITSSYRYQIAEDGRSILYISGGKLYKISKFDGEMADELLYDDKSLDGFIASRDLSRIYLFTEDEQLLCYKSPKKTERISNDFDYYDGYAVYSEAAGRIFYVEDHNLYSAGKNARSRELVAEDVRSLAEFVGGILYGTEEGDTYYMEDKKTVLLSR